MVFSKDWSRIEGGQVVTYKKSGSKKVLKYGQDLRYKRNQKPKKPEEKPKKPEEKPKKPDNKPPKCTPKKTVATCGKCQSNDQCAQGYCCRFRKRCKIGRLTKC